MDTRDLIKELTIDEISKGYYFDSEDNSYQCIACNANYQMGEIYPCGQKYYDAHKMIEHHLQQEHKGIFNYLINLSKQITGISPNQKEVLILMQSDQTDEEIAQKLKLSISTVRNYRFRFKEKEKQAKIFIALMQLLNEKNNNYKLITPHKNATTVDDRYVITEADRNKTLKNTFDEHGKLLVFPRKEKRKIIVLTEIAKNFKEEKIYTEKEVNRLLKRIFDDYVTIRRYLIEYGFLDRNNDGSKYWLNN